MEGNVMKRKWSLYLVVLALVIVGLLAFGVPASTLSYPALALASPLMVIFMQGGHGDHNNGGEPATGGGR